MFLAIFPVVLGFGSSYFGGKTFNDPNCYTASIAIKWRRFDVTCYPFDASLDGPIPGKIYALSLIAAGLIFLAIGATTWIEYKKKKLAKSAGYRYATEILGEVKGQAPALFGLNDAEGNLFWSIDKFLFVPDDPFLDGRKSLGPIHFDQVPLPKFRIPVISSQGYLLTFEDEEIGLTFESTSGKLKNLMKIMKRYKQQGFRTD